MFQNDESSSPESTYLDPIITVIGRFKEKLPVKISEKLFIQNKSVDYKVMPFVISKSLICFSTLLKVDRSNVIYALQTCPPLEKIFKVNINTAYTFYKVLLAIRDERIRKGDGFDNKDKIAVLKFSFDRDGDMLYNKDPGRIESFFNLMAELIIALEHPECTGEKIIEIRENVFFNLLVGGEHFFHNTDFFRSQGDLDELKTNILKAWCLIDRAFLNGMVGKYFNGIPKEPQEVKINDTFIKVYDAMQQKQTWKYGHLNKEVTDILRRSDLSEYPTPAIAVRKFVTEGKIGLKIIQKSVTKTGAETQQEPFSDMDVLLLQYGVETIFAIYTFFMLKRVKQRGIVFEKIPEAHLNDSGRIYHISNDFTSFTFDNDALFKMSASEIVPSSTQFPFLAANPRAIIFSPEKIDTYALELEKSLEEIVEKSGSDVKVQIYHEIAPCVLKRVVLRLKDTPPMGIFSAKDILKKENKFLEHICSTKVHSLIVF